MGVVSVVERFDTNGEFADTGFSKYVRRFTVLTDNPNDRQATVLTAIGIPRTRDIYASGNEIDLAATCRSITATADSNSRTAWTVEAQYSSEVEDDNAQNEPNPLLRPSVVEWDFLQTTKIVDRDINNAAIDTAADEPFDDPPPEIDDARLVLRITRNQITYDVQQAYDYINAVNSDVFFGGAAKTWKCAVIRATSQTEIVNQVQITYWPTTYEFHYRAETWQLKLLHKGKWQKVAGERVKITDAIGQPVQSAVPLDAAGAKLAVGGAVTFLTFDVYNAKPFGILNLP